MRALLLVAVLGLTVSSLQAQLPNILTVTPVRGGTQSHVIITGSGFNATPANLAVYFDNVQAVVNSSSEFTIDVTVPVEARTGNVEVINLVSGLSGKSAVKFSPYYGGTTFDPTQVSAPLSISSTKELFDICSCDFDRDGKTDFAVSKFSTVDDPQATDLVVLKNGSSPGAMSFTAFNKGTLANLNVNSPTFNVNCGDLDGDGKPDLVATRGGATRNSIYLLRNTNSVVGTLAFGAPQALFMSTGEFAFRVSIRDLNFDGKPELIVSNSFDDPNTDNMLYIFVNQSTPGTISFSSTPVKLEITGAGTTYGLDVQDLDGDQKPEIIVNQFQTNNLFILKNQSTGQISFGAPQKITFTAFFNNIATGDLNADGLTDLMLTSTFDNFLHVFINQSTASAISFKTAISLATSDQPWGLDVSDVDGDQDLDVIVGNKNQALINVFTSDGAASPAFTRKDITTAKAVRNIKVGDFDGDAKPDFAFTSLNTSNQYSVDFIRSTNCVQPTILNPAGMFLCAGQTKTLQTTPVLSGTFDWKLNGVSFQNSASPTADITTPGSYTVTVTGEGGSCVQTSAAYVVSNSAGIVPTSPTIGSNGPVCVGGTLNLTAPAVASAVYAWDGPGMPAAQKSVQNPVIANITAQQAGSYTLTITVGSCSSQQASSTIDVATFPAFAITPSTNLPVCQGTSLTLSVANAANYTYQWLLNGNAVAGQTARTISVTQEGDYSLRATNSLLSCTTTTPATTVAILTTPVPGFTVPANICVGATQAFTDQSQSDARATVVYNWNFGDATTSALVNPTHAYATAGAKTATLTLTYSGSTVCTGSTSKPVTVVAPAAPVITPSVAQSCPGESVTLTIPATFTAATWSNQVTGTSTIITQPGLYKVKTTDANGCQDSTQLTILSRPVPTVKASADQTTIVPGVVVKLTATGADTYSWTPASTLDNATSATPSATPQATTRYIVTGTLTGGCSAKDSVDVTVELNGAFPAPVLFTPNGDGDNELWKIPGIEAYVDCTLTVFDERGSKVFQKKGYANDWDGTNGTQPLPEGVYYFVMSCPDKAPITGSVLIKRE